MRTKVLASIALIGIGAAVGAALSSEPASAAGVASGRWQISRQVLDDGWTERAFLLDTATGTTWLWNRTSEQWQAEPH